MSEHFEAPPRHPQEGSALVAPGLRPGPELPVFDRVETAARIRTHIRRQAADVMAIGQELLAAKQALMHGDFQDWLTTDLQMSPRTAQQYMRAYLELGDKSAMVAHLPPSAIYKLTAPSLPRPVRQKVLALAQEGKRVSASDVTAMAAADRADRTRPAPTVEHVERVGSEFTQALGQGSRPTVTVVFNGEVIEPRFLEPHRRRTAEDWIAGLKFEVREVNNSATAAWAKNSSLVDEMRALRAEFAGQE